MTKRRIAPWKWNWKWRITDNEWRSAMWDRSAPIIAALALVLLLASGAGNLIQGYVLIHSGNLHHTQTATQNTAILKVLNEHSASLAAVKKLQKEFSTFEHKAGPAIEKGQASLQAEIDRICANIQGCVPSGP